MKRQKLKTGRMGARGDLSKKVSPFVDDEGYWSCSGFHFDEVGSLTKWNGFSKYNTAQAAENTFTGIFDYQKSDGTSQKIATGLTGIYKKNATTGFDAISLTSAYGARTGTADNLYDFMMLNDILYLCNGVDNNIKYNGSAAYKQTIEYPSAALTGVLNDERSVFAVGGTYSYKYTYYNSAMGHESRVSPVSNEVSPSMLECVLLRSIAISTDPQVDKIRIYRTTDSGAVWQFIKEIGNYSITAPNDPVVVSDSGVAGNVSGTDLTYKYTFYNSTDLHESAPSGVSNTLTVTNKKVLVTFAGIAVNANYDKIRIYRKHPSAAEWGLAAEIPVTDVDGVSGTYLDNTADITGEDYVQTQQHYFEDNLSDATLGIAVDETAYQDSVKSKSMEIYKNHAFFADVTNPSRIRVSMPGYPNIVDPDDYFDLNPSDGDSITGIKRLGSLIAAYKENSIWNGFGDDIDSFRFDTIVEGFGAVNKQCIVNVPGQGRQIFIMPTGAFGTYNGSSADFEGLDIQPVTRALNKSKLLKAWGVAYPAKNMCLWIVPNGAATQNDLMIVYDYVQNKWATRPLTNTNANCIGMLEDANSVKNFYIGGYGGYVWKGDDGTDDDGSAIACELIDRGHPKGQDNLFPEALKCFYEIRVFFKTQASVSITVSYALDDPDSAYTVVGTIDTSATTGQGYVRFNAQARRLYPKFTQSGTASPVTIRGWQVESYNLGRVV